MVFKSFRVEEKFKGVVMTEMMIYVISIEVL
jgi:hypothetical protein